MNTSSVRIILLITLCLMVAGCPEFVRGPRVVHYNPNWFYVRHMPWIDGDEAIAQLAAEECLFARRGPAQLDEAMQIYPFDLRYAVWRCEREPEPGEPEPGESTTPDNVGPARQHEPR
ncbi:MAG: hypothetical protein U1E42_06830 [Rhodospirillales bacterium]